MTESEAERLVGKMSFLKRAAVCLANWRKWRKAAKLSGAVVILFERQEFELGYKVDVVRLWRTMAVDYAAKNSDRNLKKWAVRNAKLRFSRKLIFVKGLLLAYETVLSSDAPKLTNCEGSSLVPALIGMVQPAIQLPPLEILARALLRETAKGWGDAADVSRTIFHSYDEFLGIMGDAHKRQALEALDINDAVEDSTFERIRIVSRDFERGLIKFLLDGPENVRNLTRDYAIF